MAFNDLYQFDLEKGIKSLELYKHWLLMIYDLFEIHLRRAKSVELTHVELVSVGALDDHIAVEHIFELQFVQTIQVALQCCITRILQRKDDLRPGILSGWANTCLSWRTIIDIALP